MGNGEAYSKAVKSGKTTYFVDVKEAKNGNLYLSITESQFRPKDGGQVNGNGKRKTTIRIFGETIAEFRKAVDEAAASVRQQ